MANLTLKIIDNIFEFAGLQGVWNDLLKRSTADTIFLTWEWMYTWWECFGEGKKLFIIVAENDGEIVGIAPLHITSSRFFGILSRKHVEYLGTSGVITEYTDFIIQKGREQEVINAFLDFLFEYSSEWDLLNLVSMRQEAINLRLIKGYCNRKALPVWENNSNISPYIELPTTLDEYMQSLGRDARWRFRKRKKKLESSQKVEMYETKNKESVSRDFTAIKQLHQKRWEEKGGLGSFAASKINYIKFHNYLIERFFDKGWLYLIQLLIDGESAACQYNFIYNNTLYYHSAGFDPKWAAQNVGSVLQLYAIDAAINKGIKEFDFLRGTEQYKYSWTKKEHVSVDIVICKDTSMEGKLLFEKKIRKAVRRLLPDRFAEKIYSGFTRRN